MKYIVVIPDGMADHPIESLGRRTPLEASHSKNMDYLAQNGFIGLVNTIPAHMEPGSDVGNLSIMGYNPQKYFCGRAALEAANLGIELADDEIAFRCNLVTTDKEKMIDYSAGHISTHEASSMIESLNQAFHVDGVKFYTGKSYRHLMVIKSRNVQDLLKLKCTPPHDIMGQEIKKHYPKGKNAPLLLKYMEKSCAILAQHSVNKVRIDLQENPATMIWLWGQGQRPNLPSFKERYGLDGAIISAVDLVNGIGRVAGLENISVPGITGYYDTNYLGKAEYALKALEKKDIVFIHIEAPDEAGHNGDAKAKICAIEHIDREVIGTIIQHFKSNDDFRILVLPDHPTPVEIRTHVREPVGFVMFGKGIGQNGASEFNENTAKDKGLKFSNGEELMSHFIKG